MYIIISFPLYLQIISHLICQQNTDGKKSIHSTHLKCAPIQKKKHTQKTVITMSTGPPSQDL
jgi:hypothetical protein